MKSQSQAVNPEDSYLRFSLSAMAGPSVHPNLRLIEVSIVDARFTGTVLPPWIAKVELILKYSDEAVLQRRTA